MPDETRRLAFGPTPIELNELMYANRDVLAAICGSFVSTVSGFPLDSVKSRLQVKRYSSVLDCITKTYSDEGFKGFFRGVTLPLLTITIVRTASFTIYTNVKSEIKNRGILRGDNASSVALLGFAGGASSGVMLSLGTSAFEYTKIKLQLEYLTSVKLGVPFEPRGTVQGFLDLYRKGGIRGLYTGFRLHATRDTLGTGLYYSFYDTTRHSMLKNKDSPSIKSIPQWVTTFACGSMAGIASWAVIYPVDLVKAKVQRNALADSAYETPLHIFKRLSAGGISRLYRGLGVSATRSLFTHGLMWTVLEYVRSEIEISTGHGHPTIEDVP